MKITSLHVWRDVISKGYMPLESFLSVQRVADECILCVDPEFVGDLELAYSLADKLSKRVRVIEFAWPKDVLGDGSRIGIASQYALQQVTTEFALNVQADEIYPVMLAEYLHDMWRKYVRLGLDCLNLKVLNLEHNMQQYQGGDEQSTWRWQSGAGYNTAIKLFRHCPAIRFAHDGWSMDGCAMVYTLPFSLTCPIIHAHDNFRDTLIALRRTAATEIWTDQEKFGHYKQSADHLEATRDEWWNDPKWTNPVAKFHDLLPDYVKPLVGQTHYTVRYDVLEAMLNEV